MQPYKIAIIVLSGGAALCCQTSKSATEQGGAQSQIVSVPDLGFTYTPPLGLEEVTLPADRERRNHEASHSAKTLDMLLDMHSSTTDTLPDWRQLWIEAYPRALLSKITDTAAEEKMNTAAAGPRGVSVGKPQAIMMAGRTFLMSEFEDKEPPLLKHAKIYTTICKTQLVSFIFVSNSAEQMKSMEDSLKSLNFSGH
jgi:hypothetical protein